jgi:nucleotide-binding universal stress UspA family protein
MLKSLLVHLQGTPGDGATLAAAFQAARPFTAHLECLHIQSNVGEIALHAVAANENGRAIVETFEMLRRLSNEAATRASDAYTAFRERESILHAETPPAPGQPSAAFRQTIGNELADLILESRYHDLVAVKGGGEQAGGFSLFDLGRLLMGAGKPVLLAPDHHASPLRTAVIAWKDVPEAARAVTAAMPLLEKAAKVFVFHASETGESVSGPGRIVRLLQWHGLNAQSHPVVYGERDPADAMLEMARAAEADLLVMGAYGQNRLSELILGGFTRTILEDASLPVLLFH